MNQCYVTEKNFECFSYKGLKEASGSYQRTKEKQKTVLVNQLNTLIDQGLANNNVSIIHQYNEAIGIVISTFETIETIYILSFFAGEYYINLLHPTTFQVFERIHFHSKLLRDTRRNMLLCLLNGLITIVAYNSIYQFYPKEQKSSYNDLFCSSNEKLLLQNLIPLTFYQNSVYGIFENQVVKLQEGQWTIEEFENQDSIDLKEEVWLDLDFYPCKFPFSSQVVVQDSWFILGKELLFIYEFKTKKLKNFINVKSRIYSTLFFLNDKIFIFGKKAIYGHPINDVYYPISNSLLSININNKIIKESYCGNLRALFSPIVREDKVMMIGGINFPKTSNNFYCHDITQIIFENPRNLWNLIHLFSDIKIIVKNEVFNLHKIMLIKLMNFFPNLVQDKEIIIDEDPDKFREIIEYLYYRKDISNLNDKDFKFLGKEIKKDLFISLKDNLKLISDLKALSDVIITTNDSKQFYCHKLILSSYSEYFYIIFTRNFQEYIDKIIQIVYSSELFQRFYCFIYRSEVSIPSILFGFDLLEFSKFFNSIEFKTKILKIINAMINIENAFTILYQLKERNMNYKNLKRKCMEVLEQNMTFEDVVDTCVSISISFNNIQSEKKRK